MGLTLATVASQLDGSLPEGPIGQLVIAYEPVWAIGTGLTATAGDVAEVHAWIRERLALRFGPAGRACDCCTAAPSNRRTLRS